MGTNAILFDSSRCTACRGCQVACKCWNNLPSPMEKNINGFTGSYQSPMDLNGDTRLVVTFNEKKGSDKGVMWAFGRRSCMHCNNPACVSVCPSGALSVDGETGFVAVNEDKCIGCKYCSAACPFEVPRYHETEGKPKINKCTACLDRIVQGRKPACVQTCAPGALQYGSREDLLATATERVGYLQGKGYAEAALYGENELDGLHVLTVMKFNREAYGLPESPEVSPLITLLDIMKPLASIGVGALIAGLGLSFVTGIGYRRNTLHYDEVAHDVIDVDTGEVVKHIDTEGEGE